MRRIIPLDPSSIHQPVALSLRFPENLLGSGAIGTSLALMENQTIHRADPALTFSGVISLQGGVETIAARHVESTERRLLNGKCNET